MIRKKIYEGRKFTLCGHLVGNLGDVLAFYHYNLSLLPDFHEKHDAINSNNRLV